jgi:integrase
LPWHILRYSHVAALRAALMEQYAPATVNKQLAALRGTLAVAWRLGQMTADDLRQATDVKTVRGSTVLRGRALTAGEIAALMGACENDHGPAGVRDAAIFAVALVCGLRREELTALDVADYDPTTGQIAVRSGKGAKGRTVYAVNGAADALADWLTIRGGDAGPLFLPMYRGGRLMLGQRMTPQSIFDICKRRGAEAGIRDFGPHDLRRTMITSLLDAGIDTFVVSKLAGHSDPATTARYDRRPESAKRDAAGRLHVPYHPRML